MSRFSQTQQMLDILEQAVANEGYTYRRMDGTTPVAHRMGLVDSFNDAGNVGGRRRRGGGHARTRVCFFDNYESWWFGY